MDQVLAMLRRLFQFDGPDGRLVLLFEEIQNYYPLISGYFEVDDGKFFDLTYSDLQISGDPSEVAFIDRIIEYSKNLNIIGGRSGDSYFDVDLSNPTPNIRMMVLEDGVYNEGRALEHDSRDRASLLASIIFKPITVFAGGYTSLGILYDLDTFDESNIAALNRYFTEFLRTEIPDLKTVIFVRTHKLDEAFYRSPIRCVGAIKNGQFIQISPADRVIQLVGQLAPTLNQVDPLVVFLGAGPSNEAGLPLGESLLRKSIMDLLGTMVTSMGDDEMAGAFWKYVRERGTERTHDQEYELRLERVISEQIEFMGNVENAPTILHLSEQCAKTSPTSAHGLLAALIKRGHKIVIITTNYDNLMEMALESEDLVFSVISNEAQAGNCLDGVHGYLTGESQVVPVLKIHGSIDDLAGIAASVEDTTVLGPAMRTAIEHILARSAHQELKIRAEIRVLFCGYSFRDVDVMSVLREDDVRQGMDPWVVDPLPQSLATDYINLSFGNSVANRSGHILSTYFGLFMKALDEAILDNT